MTGAAGASRWTIVGEAPGAAPPPDTPTPPPREAILASAAVPGAILGLLETLRGSELVVNRLGSPDLSAQLAAAVARPVDTVVCSLLDADDTAPVNATAAEDFSEEVAVGAAWLAAACKAARVLAVTARSIAPVRAFARAGIRPVAIAHAYPQLHPSLLLKIVLKRRLSVGRPPTDVGVLVLDAAAAYVVAQCATLLTGAASTAAPGRVRIPVAWHDLDTSRTAFALADARTHWRNVMQATQLPSDALEDEPRAWVGARLTGRAGDLSSTVGRCGEVTLHVGRPARPLPVEPCIRCGWCHDVCPTGVEPALLLDAAQFGSPALAERAGIAECLRCGVCQYVCPSSLPLLRAIDDADALVKAASNSRE